jgi:hypothetical protein
MIGTVNIHRHVTKFETVVEYGRRMADGREPTYEFCELCGCVPTGFIAAVPVALDSAGRAYPSYKTHLRLL